MSQKTIQELTLEEVQELFKAANVSEEALEEFANEFWRLFSAGE